MDAALARLVWTRADSTCEYCRIPKQFDAAPFHIDHVIARQHRGTSTDENLALACFQCNTFKGPNIAGIDPESGALTRLFHPRQDRWEEHFEWRSAVLLGRTAVGRTTISVLEINALARVRLRESLIAEKAFPRQGRA
jgi:hypothetical protein